MSKTTRVLSGEGQTRTPSILFLANASILRNKHNITVQSTAA
ncbi:hypothetical protein PCIT_a2296 [Pseudoalteromonas citrea]|uniref:Uncharacterized protein n=1 Tax=Pseudoalteromonas citrea TaxID=43655 RepID=A0AAD4AJW7_9GAMM|nr:hypothetical protein PCIT_a2296 [Pseudoalteromonas citrea]